MCKHQPTFIDGIGLGTVFPDLWTHLKTLIDKTVAVSLSSVANAIRVLVREKSVVAEGAGAASVAAALSGSCGSKGKAQ